MSIGKYSKMHDTLICICLVALTFPGCTGKSTEEPFEATGGGRMSDLSLIDYSSLDHPDILGLLFHPRPEWYVPEHEEGVEYVSIPVENGISLGNN